MPTKPKPLPKTTTSPAPWQAIAHVDGNTIIAVCLNEDTARDQAELWVKYGVWQIDGSRLYPPHSIVHVDVRQIAYV